MFKEINREILVFMKILQTTKLRPQLQYPYYCCEFEISNFANADFAAHQIPFPAQLSKAVDKRKAEYLAGRVCAKHVLAAHKIYNFELINAADRAPIWPNKIVGSITHSQQTAMAMVSHSSDIAGIGIDIEQLMSAKQEQELQQQILHPDELSQFQRLAKQVSHPLTIIFSAKESIFKAYTQTTSSCEFQLDLKAI